MSPLKIKSRRLVIKVCLAPPLWCMTLSAGGSLKTISVRALFVMALTTFGGLRFILPLGVTALAVNAAMFTHEGETTLSVMIKDDLLETILTVTLRAG